MNQVPPLFGKLEYVSPRDAWHHEALALTPWLSQNLDRLGAAIGLQLDLEGIEQRVAPFAADILARDVRGDRLVLIENQLEPSDHKHLGQIMTYLAGLDTKVMIWVAPSFAEPHLSAIRWLNEHTVEPFAFFAVRLRVVRIGESPFAPLFEAIEQPNNWERDLQSKAREAGELSEVAQRRRTFWKAFEQRFPDSSTDTIGGGGSSRWRRVTGADLFVSQWISADGVGVFVRGGRGVAAAETVERLQPHRELLEQRLATKIGASYPFHKKQFADVSDPATWPHLIDWLDTQTKLYAAALSEVYGMTQDAS